MSCYVRDGARNFNYSNSLRDAMRLYDATSKEIRNQVLYPLSYGACRCGRRLGRCGGIWRTNLASRRLAVGLIPRLGLPGRETCSANPGSGGLSTDRVDAWATDHAARLRAKAAMASSTAASWSRWGEWPQRSSTSRDTGACACASMRSS